VAEEQAVRTLVAEVAAVAVVVAELATRIGIAMAVRLVLPKMTIKVGHLKGII
jgi:hypothetical protein